MDYEKLAPKEVVNKTIDALKERGIRAEFVNNGEEALGRLKDLIPDGAEIMTGSSTTLDQIGFVDLLKSKNHPWENLKDAIVAEKDPAKQAKLRKQSVTADYFLGSVHAITQSGEIITASASGSQLPSYAFASDNVIWVASTNKIVPTFEDGMKRIREYVYPLEDKRMKSLGFPGSFISKLLIIEREMMPNRKLTLILVNEKLGF